MLKTIVIDNLLMSGFEPLVAFNNNFDDSDLYYFDFNDNTWKGCEPIGRLPYDLCKYKAINSDHEFITCVDSYCLTDNLEDVLSNDEMHKEKEWRDSIVKAQEEVDMLNKGEWHKMIVAWVKADVIPGVLHLRKRRDDRGICGYFYKESKRLAKSQTKTPIITEQQLQEEKEYDERVLKNIQEKKDRYKEIEKTLKLYKIKEEFYHIYAPTVKDVVFYDTLPYYQSLRLDTEQKIISKEDWFPEAKKTYEEYLAYSNREKGFVNLIKHTAHVRSEDKTADMVSVEDKYTDIKNCYAPLKTDYDAFYNIKIYNATYAKLVCDYKEIDCDVIGYSVEDKQIFGFFDITEKNPIFNSTISNTIYIDTDGDEITFNGILMDFTPRHIIKNAQKFTINHFPMKGFLLQCNTFCGPTMPWPYERIEETPHNYSSYELT